MNARLVNPSFFPDDKRVDIKDIVLGYGCEGLFDSFNLTNSEKGNQQTACRCTNKDVVNLFAFINQEF